MKVKSDLLWRRDETDVKGDEDGVVLDSLLWVVSGERRAKAWKGYISRVYHWPDQSHPATLPLDT